MKKSVLLACTSAAALCPMSTLQAQDLEEPEDAIDNGNVIVVTGSNIDGIDVPVPVEQISRDDIDATGAQTLTDLAINIPSNTNGEFNSFTFRQTSTLGTAQINLRGLGLGATLVLLDGRRNVLTATYADDGNSFVDINTIPLSLIERVEVVKSGASAIYGSDAIAGVVNLVPRTDFEGLELEAGFQTTTDASQEDLTLSGLAGARFGDIHMTFAASYLDRSPLDFDDRGFTQTGTEIENIARPGSFVLLAPPANPAFAGAPVGVPIPDPSCAEAGGTPQTPAGFCLVDTSNVQQLVATEERLALFGNVSADLSPDLTGFVQVGYSDNSASIRTFPSLPGSANSLIVPPNNPNNPFGAPALFVGRPVGVEFAFGATETGSETWRVATGVDWSLASGVDFSLSYVHSENDFTLSYNDALAAPLQAALAGGGAVEGEFFNVFGTTITQDAINSPELINSVLARPTVDYSSKIDVVELGVQSPLNLSEAMDLGFAVGAQYRRNAAGFDTDDLLGTPGTLVFSAPVDDFPEQAVDVIAGYAEVAGEVLPGVDLQIATRFEDYGGSIGSSFDPKGSIKIEVSDGLSLRANGGTSFRAPNPLQLGGQTVQATPIVNPCTGARGPVAIRTSGNSDLEPEDSFSYGAGVALDRGGFRASIDYWNYDYEDVIARESAEAVAAGAQCVSPAPGVLVPQDPRITINPATGQISSIDVAFVNTGQIETDGLDFIFGYTASDSPVGRLSIDTTATLITGFDLQSVAGGTVIDGLDQRNISNFARSTPNFRGNIRMSWENGRHRANVNLRYIDSYTDELATEKIESHTTLDLQYAVSLDDLIGSLNRVQLSLGVNNVFDQDPPFVFDRGGYDPTVHDPRGRLVYARLKVGI